MVATIEEVTLKNGRVSFVRFMLEGSKYKPENNTYFVSFTPYELVVDVLKPVYDRRRCDDRRRLGVYNRAENIFTQYPYLSHVCGAQGFGYPGDRCPACDPTDFEKTPLVETVKEPTPNETRTLSQVLYSLNQHGDKLEKILAEGMRL